MLFYFAIFKLIKNNSFKYSKHNGCNFPINSVSVNNLFIIVNVKLKKYHH